MNLVELLGHCGIHVNCSHQVHKPKDRKQKEWDETQFLVTKLTTEGEVKEVKATDSTNLDKELMH